MHHRDAHAALLLIKTFAAIDARSFHRVARSTPIAGKTQRRFFRIAQNWTLPFGVAQVTTGLSGAVIVRSPAAGSRFHERTPA